ncbi:hypothetical protein CJU90_3297 [Yarrowia sp. C11]|nr:hypothetical protein CJU90_3297 [Yarrowia sp. C11]
MYVSMYFAATAAAAALSSPKHGKHDVVPDEVQAAYTSYESSHGKALPAGSRIETRDAVYVVEDEAKRKVSPRHSPKQSSVSQSVQNKFSEIDRQIKSRKSPQSPTQAHHTAHGQPHAAHPHAQATHAPHAHTGQPPHSQTHAQPHAGHQAVHHPVLDTPKSPSRSLAGNVRDQQYSTTGAAAGTHNVHQIGKERFGEKLVDKHAALQKQRADALASDSKNEQIIGAGAAHGAAASTAPTTGVASAPAVAAPATGTNVAASAPAPAAGSAAATPGTTAEPVRPTAKKRESWGNKFNAFKSRDKEAGDKLEKEEKPGGIRNFFSGLTKRNKPETKEEQVLNDAYQNQEQSFNTGTKEVPNMSGFRDTTLPDVEQSVMDGRPDEYDTSTLGGKAKAGVASVVGAIGLGQDGGQPEPAHGFAAARDAAAGGHQFAGERVLADARAESQAQPLGEVPGANTKVGATGLPTNDEFGAVVGDGRSELPKDYKLGDKVADQLRSGQAGVGVVPPYHKNGEHAPAAGKDNTTQNTLAQDARLDDTLPYKSKLDASGLPLKQYADRNVSTLEDSTKVSEPDYSPNFAKDASLDPTLPHNSQLSAAGLPLASAQGSSGNPVSGDFNLKSNQIAGDVTKVGNDPRFAHAAGTEIKPKHELAIEDGPRSLDPGSAVSGDFNLKANQIAGDKTKIGNDPRFAHATDEVIKPMHELAIGDGPATGASSGNPVSGDFNLKSNQIAGDITKVGNDPRFAESSSTIKPAHELAIGDGPSTGSAAPAAGNAVSGDFNLKANQIVDDKTKVGSDPRFAAGSGSSSHPTRELEITDGPSSTGNPVSGDFNLKSNQIAGDKIKVGNDPRFASGASSSSKPAHELEITDPGHFKPATGAFNLGSNEIAGDVTKIGNDPRFVKSETGVIHPEHELAIGDGPSTSGAPSSGNPVSGDFNLKANQIVDDKTKVGNDPRFAPGASSSSKPAHELEITDPGHFQPATGAFNLGSNEIAGDVTKVGNDPRFASGTQEKELTDPGHFKPATGAFNLGSNEIAGDVTKVGNDPRFAHAAGSEIKPKHELAIGDGPSTSGAPASGNPVSGDFNLKANQIVDDKTKVGNDPRFASGTQEKELTDPGHFKPATGAFNLGSNEIADDVTKIGNDPRFVKSETGSIPKKPELEIGDGPSSKVPGSFGAVSGDFNLKAEQIAEDITQVTNDPRFSK